MSLTRAARDAILTHRLVPVIRHLEGPSARSMAFTTLEVSSAVIELTTTIPGIFDLATQLRNEFPTAAIGLGTVTSAGEVDRAVAAGVDFIVSPGLSEALVEACNSLGVLYIPGILTPTEAMKAIEFDCTLVKLFPASTVGASHLHALKEVFPGMDFMPTGGVSLATLRDWLDAGSAAFGIASALSRSYDTGGNEALRDVLNQYLAVSNKEKEEANNG